MTCQHSKACACVRLWTAICSNGFSNGLNGHGSGVMHCWWLIHVAATLTVGWMVWGVTSLATCDEYDDIGGWLGWMNYGEMHGACECSNLHLLSGIWVLVVLNWGFAKWLIGLAMEVLGDEGFGRWLASWRVDAIYRRVTRCRSSGLYKWRKCPSPLWCGWAK